MDIAKASAFEEVTRLVNRYSSLTTSKRRSYNEANTRKDYILPLFGALGWDVGNAGTERQVVEESKVGRKRVDYAKQAVGYAYSRGVPWALLTNFSDLMVFSAEWEGLQAAQVRALNLTWRDYLPHFEKLWLVSRPAFESHLLDEDARTSGRRKARLPIEQTLFDQLRSWRARLTTELHHWNGTLTFAEVDHLVQTLFNRLIFIRNVEDRAIEDNHLISALHDWQANSGGRHLMDALREVFQYFADEYDSELFPRLEIEDPWRTGVYAQDDTLTQIISGLYDTPGGMAVYDFKGISEDVLGRVYEQYLGYVTREGPPAIGPKGRRGKRTGTTASQGVLPMAEEAVYLEERRNKRKAHGIYYTPGFVVDYLVKQTVGRFLSDRTDNEIHNVTVLDMACGSGPFLIAAYRLLLEHKARTRGKTVDGLDNLDRQAVLTQSIFGVDLDRQAVEFARLNLLMHSLCHREILHPLHDNVKQGNALIDGSEAKLRPYFGDEWHAKHPFDWETEWPHVARQGGFDIIVGNPPYVRIQTQAKDEVRYFGDHYQAAVGNYDIYVLFVERALQLLKPGGLLGFILPTKWFQSVYGKGLRQLIADGGYLAEVVDFTHQQVFGEAATYTCLLLLEKKPHSHLKYSRVHELEEPQAEQLHIIGAHEEHRDERMEVGQVAAPPPGDAPWVLTYRREQTVLEKVTALSRPLCPTDDVFVGLQTSADDVYILTALGEPRDGVWRVREDTTDRAHDIEAGLLHRLLTGRDVQPYWSPPPPKMLLFPYEHDGVKATLIPPDSFADRYPLGWSYLNSHKATLEERENGKMRRPDWYGYVYPKNLTLHGLRKLAVPRLVNRLRSSLDLDGAYFHDNVDINGIILHDQSADAHKFITGLLNSQLLNWCFMFGAVRFNSEYFSANRQFIENLPIRMIDPADAAAVARRDKLIAVVEEMVELTRRLNGLTPFQQGERDEIERKMAQAQAAIDQTVYALYELADAEIAIVEGRA